MNMLYTAGYNAGWTPAQLHQTAIDLGAIVIDVRLNPTSNRKEWIKYNLASLLGWRYMHLPSLGNKNYRGGEIVLAKPEVGLAVLRQELAQRPVIILCACPDHTTCHRSVIAALLLEYQVTHLDPPLPLDANQTPMITVRQPWAWLIVHGPKDIENRTWRRSYRGPLGIHAAKTMTDGEYMDAYVYARARGVTLPAAESLTLGAIVGLATVTDWVDEHPSPWFMGPYGLVLADRRPLAEPIPARGTQGLWPYVLPEGVLI